MDAPEVTKVIEDNHLLAQRMQISGTPTFVMGEQMLRGYAPLELDAGDRRRGAWLTDFRTRGQAACIPFPGPSSGRRKIARKARLPRTLSGAPAANDALTHDPGIAGWTPPEQMLTIYRSGNHRLPLFLTCSQFGAAGKATLVEMMFPADTETEGTLTVIDAG